MPVDTGFIGAAISGAENSMDRQGGTLFNHYWARRNEALQVEQSATAYQRAVADMKAAGLNPMLAYSQGGASSAQGAKAQYVSGSRDPGAGFTSAQMAKQQIKNMQEQNRILAAEASKAEVEKQIYKDLAPAVKAMTEKIGQWSAASVKDSPGLLDAARGKTTDVMEWIGERLKGFMSWGDKGTWIKARDEYVTKEK